MGERRLIIVDDNAPFRTLLARAAREMGWVVEMFADGAALNARGGEGGRADLILLDVMMPRADGFDAIDAIATHHPAARVMLVTGGPMLFAETVRELARSRDVKVEMILSKPVSLQELQAILRPGD